MKSGLAVSLDWWLGRARALLRARSTIPSPVPQLARWTYSFPTAFALITCNARFDRAFLSPFFEHFHMMPVFIFLSQSVVHVRYAAYSRKRLHHDMGGFVHEISPKETQ